MTSQDQNIDHSEIKNSSVQQSQAGRDAVSFNNSHDNRVVIENTFLRLFGRSESNQVDWDWAKLLLEKKQLPDIRKRLTDTLGRERILMDVSISEQQQWVNRLQADRQVQVNGKDGDLLDPSKLLIETFGRDDISGKLLILGAPGSGKTTALLSLAEQLVIGARSQSQTVIPVILELSTWREDSQSIEAWIIEQLYDLHGGNRKRKIYEQWLERQVLLPLLDGLDELGLERQKKCTEKLNEFARTYPQLVVCCRVREFETANIKLSNLNGAICLQALSNEQIEAYFQSINRTELGSVMETNSVLQGLLQETTEGEPGLLRVPLFIKLLADVYDPQEPILSKTDLLKKYIERQLSFDQREHDHRKGLQNHLWVYKTFEKEPRLDKTINSLSWVARQLQVNNTVELLIEQMQPSFLNPRLQRFYASTYCFALSYSLTVFMMIFMTIGFLLPSPLTSNNRSELFNGLLTTPLGIVSIFLVTILVYTLVGFTGLYFYWRNKGHLIKIQPVEIIQVFSSSSERKEAIKKIKKSVHKGLIHGYKIGLFLILFAWIIVIISIVRSNLGILFSLDLIGKYILPALAILCAFILSVAIGLIEGLILGLIGGFIYGIFTTFKQEIKTQSYPNQGIWNSLQSFLLITTFTYPLNVIVIFVLPSLLLREGTVKNPDWLLRGLWGIFFSLLFGIFFGGGIACIQHFSLRFVLWKSGTIPWNFARFLNYCVERRLLLRVGGRYRFLHRELLDHFAQLPPGTQIK